MGIADGVAQNSYVAQSRLAEGRWYRIPVDSAGVYVVTPSDLPSLRGADCDKVALFGAVGGMLPVGNNAVRPDDLSPVAVEVVDRNGNGVVDSDDYVLFYGEGPSVWRYVDKDGLFEYEMHAYANHNYYFLTLDCDGADTLRRVAVRNYTATSGIGVSTCTAVALYHVDRVNPVEGGTLWMADKYTVGMPTRNYTLSLPSGSVSGNVTLRYGLAHMSNYGGQFAMQANGERWSHNLNAATTYSVLRHELASGGSGSVALTVTYAPRENSAAGYLDFVEVSASVPIHYGGGQQFFRHVRPLRAGEMGRFDGSGYREGLRLWDVSEPMRPQALTLNPAGDGRFDFAAPVSDAGTFVVFTDAEARHPQGIAAVRNQNLHGAPVPDYVIVSHPAFVGEAERLADLHRAHSGLSVLVATQDEVYNEYSSGRTDPVAIRQMLRNLRSKDPDGIRPRYLLLFGKGTYDNRNILQSPQLTAVTYQYPSLSLNETSAYPSDDIYGYLDDGTMGAFEGQMSVGIGRLPAKTASEAAHLVDKIAGYLLRSDFANDGVRGDWRNYVTLLADDADPSHGGDSVFASDAEKMSKVIRARYPQLNVDKIFADAYVQQSGADGSYYPEVNNALRQRINYGTLLLNYIGHGSDKYIGTERYMEFSDIDKYSNDDRLAFFVTSTCSFGHYDFVGDICGGEAFLLADAAGIGIVTAARPIHHSHPFNSRVCLYALDPGNSIGDALRQAKNEVSVAHCIALLGDPALHLSVPKNEVVVTHVNGRAVEEGVIDSAQVLSRVTVEGEVRRPDGSVATDFDGTVFPIVFDREVCGHTLANDNDSTEVAFCQQKNVLYKGRAVVSGGRFSYSFVIPRDVAYHYDYAKLSHYARSSTDDASGQYGSLMFGGYDDGAVLSELYPQVRLYINDTNFRSGGITNETPALYAYLSDSVGINAAGSGIGHDITATIDGNPYSTVSLNDYYEPDIHDSRNGHVYYTLGKLTEGRHTLTLKCWNIFNYSGSATIDFVVCNDRRPQVGQFVAAPNPAHHSTSLRIEHNMVNMVQSVLIDIYDLRGSRLRQLAPAITDNGCVIVGAWDFTTAGGAVVPPGIYVARAVLTTVDGQVFSQTVKIVRR